MDKDFLLVQKMKNGNEDAMELFVRRYYPAILRYCGCHVRGRELAEDITQETFEHFFRALGSYQHIGKAQNYLYIIAGNLCKNSYRKQTELSLSGILDTAREPLPETAKTLLLNLEESIDMGLALNKLPEDFREVILLYHFQELKLREIADILNIGLPLAKYRLRKGRELLGKILREEDTL